MLEPSAEVARGVSVGAGQPLPVPVVVRAREAHVRVEPAPGCVQERVRSICEACAWVERVGDRLAVRHPATAGIVVRPDETEPWSIDGVGLVSDRMPAETPLL